MRLWLLRHATLRIDVRGLRLLVDPQLDPAGARPAVADTANDRRNPLVELPEPAQVAASNANAVLVTHTHRDHLDGTALELLAKDIPLLCQPPDEQSLRVHGFTDVRPVRDEVGLRGLTLTRTGGRHGTGEIGERMGPVSGFALTGSQEPTLYVAGDTIWCPEVADALDTHDPDVVVVNAGAARLREGDPITMTADDVVRVAEHAPHARVVAVHMEAVNHCELTRSDLHRRLHAEGLEGRVTVPLDGAEIPL
jgi:L-ascorbate metabolism protein UlaG (beta-lactamase superfamily)